MSESNPELSLESWLVTGGRPEEPGMPLNAPLVPSSNFLLGADRGYSREDGTMGWDALEAVLGGMEAGKAVAFSSGMAAAAAVFDQVRAGALIAIPEDCYQGVAGLADAGAAKGRWRVERLAIDDTERWLRACDEADLIWLESPSNPMLAVADVEVIAAAPRKPGAILAVDNTFATPINQQPLAFGATCAMQSSTKFIGGHSDLLGGVVTTRDDDFFHALRRSRTLAGATPGTLESFLALRGLRTLALRMERSQTTAMALAERLEAHPAVSRVRYPGLATHPTHEVAQRVLGGFGGMLSFDVAAGAGAADAVCAATRLIRHATSLGGVESTMERRAAIPGQEHVPPGLLRLSVGIEAAEDLWTDLDQALLSIR